MFLDAKDYYPYAHARAEDDKASLAVKLSNDNTHVGVKPFIFDLSLEVFSIYIGLCSHDLLLLCGQAIGL